MQLTIIIPVYNVEQYVEKCIRSCAEQNLASDQYEIIVVNDGSTDNSLEIATNVSEEYPNVSVYSQENKGLSGARNTGVKLAKGDYIWFIDSDDWIEPDCLKRLYDLCSENQLDLLHFQRFVVETDQSKRQIRYPSTPGVVDGAFLWKNHLVATPIQLYMINRRFFIEHKFSFVDRLYHEDSMLLPTMTLAAKRCMVIPDALYYHLQREGSIMHSIKPKNLDDLLYISLTHIELSKKYLADNDIIEAYDAVIAVWLNQYLRYLSVIDPSRVPEYKEKFMQNRCLIEGVYLKSYRGKHKLIGVLIKTLPANLFFKITKLLST